MARVALKRMWYTHTFGPTLRRQWQVNLCEPDLHCELQAPECVVRLLSRTGRDVLCGECQTPGLKSSPAVASSRLEWW